MSEPTTIEEAIQQTCKNLLRNDHVIGLLDEQFEKTVKDSVMKNIQRKPNETTEEEAKKRLADDIEKLIKGPSPEEIKLSELVEAMKSENAERYHNHYDSKCSVIVDPITGDIKSTIIGLDPEGGNDYWLCCAYYFHVNEDGRVTDMTFNANAFKQGYRHLFFDPYSEFRKLLFHLWTKESRIIIDEADVDHFYGEVEV